MTNYLSLSKLLNGSCTAIMVSAILLMSWNSYAAPNPVSQPGSAFPSNDVVPSASPGPSPSSAPVPETPSSPVAAATAAALAKMQEAQQGLPAASPPGAAPGAGISISEPPPANTIPPIPAPAMPPSFDDQSALPPPPTPAALSTDAVKLATQAEQAALQAQAQAESEKAKHDREHNEKSYDRAANGLLPLAPDQIRTFMHKLERTQEAAQPPSTGAPKGEVRIATLPLDPGAEPPVINLDAGYVTTINMLDASGEPWPILDVGVGGSFEVTPTDKGSHIVRIMPLVRYGMGDLSVLLKDLPTPVIFRLSSGGPSVDLRYDARIPKFGPNGKLPLIDHPRLEAGDGNIMMILENAPPSGAKRLKISGLDARTMAWSLDNKVFVRTPLTLLSPAWNSSVSSADGMKVYEIGDAPVLLMSDNGAMLRGRLAQEDNHD